MAKRQVAPEIIKMQKLTNYSFRSNSMIKKSGVKINFSAEQGAEFLKCKEDPIYFIEHYVSIIDPDLGEIIMKLRDYQKKLVVAMKENRFLSTKWPRQSGKSTTVAAFFCWYMIFHREKTCAILANKAATSKEILIRVQYAYERIPLWIQQGVTSWNKGSFALENGSRIIAGATSSSAIRGMTINFLFIDEVAHIGKNQWEQFYESVYSTISASTMSRIVMVSTPKGMNHFYKIHTKAQRKESSFVALDATWRDVPGRDEKWKAETIANTSQRSFDQEHDVAFLGSALTLISAYALNNLVGREPIKTTSDGRFRIYVEPEKDHTYIVTCDVAQGTENDYSAFSVIDVSVEPMEQVATFRDNTIDPETYADVIHATAVSYNEAWILVELNDVGGQVVKYLWADLGYQNMLHTRDDTNPKRQTGKPKIGIRVDRRTKKLGCLKFKSYVENSQFKINDEETISELFMFVRNPRKIDETYAAQDGFHDDTVMPLVNLSYYTTTNQWVSHVSGKNLRAALEAKRLAFVKELQVPEPRMTPPPEQPSKQIIFRFGSRPISKGHLSELEPDELRGFLS